ncbi:MAG: hypothetical protein KAX55_05440, partial [Propionivibrio sp.]|nr:hypothetical protein [Propionivibrio sp.]
VRPQSSNDNLAYFGRNEFAESSLSIVMILKCLCFAVPLETRTTKGVAQRVHQDALVDARLVG